MMQFFLKNKITEGNRVYRRVFAKIMKGKLLLCIKSHSVLYNLFWREEGKVKEDVVFRTI